MDDGLANPTGQKGPPPPPNASFHAKTSRQLRQKFLSHDAFAYVYHAMGQFRHTHSCEIMPFTHVSMIAFPNIIFGNSGLPFVTIACLVGCFYPEGQVDVT